MWMAECQASGVSRACATLGSQELTSHWLTRRKAWTFRRERTGHSTRALRQIPTDPVLFDWQLHRTLLAQNR